MSSKTLFVDTNIFLHYRSFDEIDWLSLLEVDYVKIRVTSIVIQELNKHKDGSSRKLRDKAAKVIKKLHQLVDAGLEVNLKPNVDICFEVSNSCPNFAILNLDPNSQDDRLLASILLFRDTNPDSSIILITADLGLRLKAISHQVKTMSLPDELKLPSELDETEKQIKELEKEILELKRRVPELRLHLPNNSDRVNYEVIKPLPPDLNVDETIKRHIEKLKEKFPKLPGIEIDAQSIAPSSKTIGQIYGSDQPEVLPWEIVSYNKQLEDFFENYSQYLAEYIPWSEIRSRIFLLEISIFNSGTCPAEDIDIFMHFPDGFTLHKTLDLNMPEKPEPPSFPSPKTREERLKHMIPSLAPSALSQIALPPNFQNRTQPNVSSPNIRHTNSYDVNVHVRKLKQNKSESFYPIFIVFDSFTQVSSFRIDYKIVAENLPKPVTGELHVIFNSEAAS